MPWLLLALPVSLLRRAVSRPVVVIGCTTILWLAVGYSLDGMSTYPAGSLYFSLLFQGLFFSLVYWRWDLLTTMAAMFTIDSWLIGSAVLQVFRTTGSFVYALPLALWLAFALAACALSFQPHLAAAYRRVAAIFE